MNINESNNDIDSQDTNDNVRNIIINKKDKKGNKKRHLNLSYNNTVGINILKDNYHLNMENNEPCLTDNLSSNSYDEHEEKNAEHSKDLENTNVSIKDDISMKSCEDNTVNRNIVENEDTTNTMEVNITNTNINELTNDIEHINKQEIVNIDKTEYNLVLNQSKQEIDNTKINLNIQNLLNIRNCNQSTTDSEIDCTLQNNTYIIKEDNVIDLTNTINDFNGQFTLLYAETDIQKYDIVEICSKNDNLFVRPLSSNNNNFYGIAVHSAEKNSKVKIFTHGVCRIKLYNNIKLPIVKLVNGKFIMMRDQKNNIFTQTISININPGDILIPMKIDDDLICGPKSVLSNYNTVSGSYLIPYKNIIFNNNNCNYNISMNNKISLGMRFAYVINSNIIDDTILVRI